MKLSSLTPLPARYPDTCAAIVASSAFPNPYCSRSTRQREGVVRGVSLCDYHLGLALTNIADQLIDERVPAFWFVDAAISEVKRYGGVLKWTLPSGETELYEPYAELEEQYVAERLAADGLRRELAEARRELAVLRHVDRENEILRARDGYKTYAITFGDKFVKIGKSFEPVRRLGELRSGQFKKPSALDPKTATLIRIWDENIERKLHTELAAHRIAGEVFDLTATPVREKVYS